MHRIALASLLCACTSGKPAPRPPSTPANVSATGGDAAVTVLWDASDGALGYRVYSGEGSLTTHADVGAVTSWTVVGLSNDHAYSFAVSALGVGGESALSAAVTATPHANPSLAVVSVTPADGAGGVARNAAVVVKFNKPVQQPVAGCGGTVQLSDDSFATCAAGSFASSDADATWTFTSSAPLHGNASYVLRVTTGQKDAHGIALAAQFQSGGFTTAPALAVSVAPSGAAGIRPQVALTFNRSVDQSSVSSIESGTACGGSVQLSAAGACVAMTHTWSGNVATFTPVADLSPSTAYTVTVTTGVKDSDGVPLDAPGSGGFTTIAGVTLLGSDFQHVTLAWTSSNGAHLYVRSDGAAFPGTPTATIGGSGGTVRLTPGKTWDLKVAPLDGVGGEQPPTEIDGVVTGFAGTAAEWESGQVATGAATPAGHFRFTWSDTEFFAAYSNSDDSATLNPANGDALWIAFDTDPAADSAGEWSTATSLTAGHEIIWPFKADYVVELKNGVANLRTVASNSWAGASAGITNTPAIDEIRFAKSLLGNPASVRIALAAVGTNAGYTFDLAPARQAAIETPTTGSLASVTSAFTPLGHGFDPAFAADTVSATARAASLVHFTVSGHAFAGTPQIAGSFAPLSYVDLSQSVYALSLTDGIANTWEGLFNFGGQSGELFFKFADAGAREPAFAADGVDRVYTLSGGNDTIPPLSWSTAYGANHGCTLTFIVTDNANPPTEVRGDDVALGNFGTASGAPLTGTNPYTTAPVTFTARDFVANPLQFKAWYGGSGTYEGTPGSTNDIMNDDVINSRKLVWTACAGSTCPTF